MFRAGWLLALGWSCSLPRAGIDGLTPIEDADGDGASAATDCDETNAAVNPSADERCNGIDDNCDGVVDDDAADRAPVYTDADSDGVGAGEPVLTCAGPSDVVLGGDCDDADFDVHPGACEHPADGVDTDCDGTGDNEIPVVATFDSCHDPMTFQTGELGPIAVRVIDSQGYSGQSAERVVHVTTSKPMILVLVSREPMHWVVNEGIPGIIERVIVTSQFGPSSVTGMEGSVDVYSDKDQLFDYDASILDMDDALFPLTGIHLTSRSDCEQFDEMTLSDGDAWPHESAEWASWQCPDDTPFTEPSAEMLPDGCHSLVVPGTPVCLTTVASGMGPFAIITQPDGDLCEFPLPTLPGGWPFGGSIAWRGDALYFCSDDSVQLARLRLSDLEVQRSFETCTAVTDWSDRVVVRNTNDGWDAPLEAFGTWGDVNSGSPMEAYPDAPNTIYGNVFAIEGDTLYMADDGSVSRFVLGSPITPLDPIPLDGFDRSITGLDVNGDGDIFVVDSDGYVRTFDSEGHVQSEPALLHNGVRGLSCFTP